MDLTTIAIILGTGKEPNLLALQEQQYELMLQRHLSEHETPFRTKLFSEDIFQRRLGGDDDLTQSPFDREISSLIEEKMALVRTVEVRGRTPKQEIRFRHDRIRDYLTHFAFLGDEQEERRYTYARDSRFIGVYDYLAKVLPLGPAERLREYLLMRAVETQDHRVSDSFIRQLSWRQRFATDDPAWMNEFDLPRAREADTQFDQLQTERSVLEQKMSALREEMIASRKMARILIEHEESTLRQLGAMCLIGMGASFENSNTDPGSVEGTLRSPGGTVFAAAAVGSRTLISAFQIELLRQRAKSLRRPVFLIVNAEVSTRPRERSVELAPEQRTALLREGIVPCSALSLYTAFTQGDKGGRFWMDLEEQWTNIMSSSATSTAD
jgi:hypothetical protein